MKALFPEHCFDNWQQVYALPDGEEKSENMRVIRHLVKGNLHNLIRRLVGGVPGVDQPEWIEKWISEGYMLPPDEFTRKRRIDEDRKRKNQQHSKH